MYYWYSHFSEIPVKDLSLLSFNLQEHSTILCDKSLYYTVYLLPPAWVPFILTLLVKKTKVDYKSIKCKTKRFRKTDKANSKPVKNPCMPNKGRASILHIICEQRLLFS